MADESDMRAKLSEELGDAIGFLEVGNILFFKIGLGEEKWSNGGCWELVPFGR